MTKQLVELSLTTGQIKALYEETVAHNQRIGAVLTAFEFFKLKYVRPLRLRSDTRGTFYVVDFDSDVEAVQFKLEADL